MNSKSSTKQTTAERAYCLWEAAGRPTGRDEEFWSRAEAELAARAGLTGTAPGATPPKPPRPPAPKAGPAHQIPSPLKAAVKTSGHRSPRPRVPKRA